MKKFIFSAAMAVVAFILLVSFNNVNARNIKIKLWHQGKMIEAPQQTVEKHIEHGDEFMIFINGEWIPMSEYVALNNGG